MNTKPQLSVWTFLCALIAGFVIVGIAHGETGQKPDSESVARGAKLYEIHCVACHKNNGVGEPTVPKYIRHPNFIEAMPLNETSHAWHHSDEQLVTMILDGNPRSQRRMPVWRGIVSDTEAADLVAYLKSLWSDRIIACQGPKHMSCM